MINERINGLINELSETELDYGLYVVAIDIGNPADITLRAINVLNKVDFVICEERKNGSKLLNQYGISKPLEMLNEHNEKQQTGFLTEKIISNQVAAALVCDGGTPLFADPGSMLVQQCHYYNIPVVPVPGASSLMSALMVSGIGYGSGQFLYYGFLPANREERIQSLYKLRNQKRMNIVFLETPYRLKQILGDMSRVLGSGRKGLIAYRMTFFDEKVLMGTLEELKLMADGLPKGQFVFILFAEKRYG